MAQPSLRPIKLTISFKENYKMVSVGFNQQISVTMLNISRTSHNRLHTYSFNADQIHTYAKEGLY